MFLLLRYALLLMLNASILLSSNSAIAAEQVVLKYRSFREFPLKSYLTLLKPANSQPAATQFSFGTTRP